MTAPVAARPAAPPASPLRSDWRRTGLAGGIGLLLLIGILGVWATLTVISGAVIANGQAIVRGKPQLVQSLDGGIVASIAVRNGDAVTKDQILLRLDPTLLAVSLESARGRLADALTLKARLEAEQQGLAEPVFDFPALPFAPVDTARYAQGQREIFRARAEVLRGGRDRLAERMRQYDSQIAGSNSQIAARRDQLGYLEKDLENLRALTSQGLARQSELSDLQRAQSDLLSQIAALETDLAQFSIARRDSTLETLQAERAFRETVVSDLRDATAKTEELILEIITRQAQLDRIEIRAPASGIVNEMQVATVGGVVAPGAILLEVVPLTQGLDFELRVDPRAIDQVYPGQRAQLVLAALDPRSTPKLEARVTTVSADAITDPKTGQSFYRINLDVPPGELARLGEARLVPGMPVEAFLETGDRSVLAYLIRPLSEQLRRAFREE